jgi:hypothetical protein
MSDFARFCALGFVAALFSFLIFGLPLITGWAGARSWGNLQTPAFLIFYICLNHWTSNGGKHE